uniref:ANK_REP_REGION domain-containing protein n=1 Tax=Rhodnius prolixus TaxID=13249 RepID=T1I7Z6_RHOPR
MTRGRKQKKRERRARENERRDCTKLISDDHDGQLTGHHSCDRGGLSITCIFKNDDLQEISNLLGTAELDDSHALLGAIALGKFDVIKRLLKNGYSLEITSEGGLTPMLWAVKLKKIEVTDFLLRRGANIHAVDVEENNALLLALQATAWDQDSFLDFWNLIKDTNINLNHTNKSGNCALHYMVKRQWDVVLEKLLSNPKVNINLLTKKGVSALMMACSRHQEDTCSILLKYKANILIEDERGCTALCYAIAYLMQKHISPHNKIVIDLIEVHKYSGQTSIEAYVQAIDRNLDNTDYCLCLFEIISQVVRGNEKPINNIDNEGLAQAFSESDLLPLMLRFIKREEKSAKKRRNNTRSRSVGQEEFGWTNTSNQAKFIKLDMALTSGKSEDDLKSLKMAESDNIKNVPSPILRGKEGLQDLCSGGDAKKNITDSISDTYWTINVPGNDNADQDEKLVYPKWKEEFKEGCALFDSLFNQLPV